MLECYTAKMLVKMDFKIGKCSHSFILPFSLLTASVIWKLIYEDIEPLSVNGERDGFPWGSIFPPWDAFSFVKRKVGDGLHASDVLLASITSSPFSTLCALESWLQQTVSPGLPHRLPNGVSQWEAPARAGEWKGRLGYFLPAPFLPQHFWGPSTQSTPGGWLIFHGSLLSWVVLLPLSLQTY